MCDQATDNTALSCSQWPLSIWLLPNQGPECIRLYPGSNPCPRSLKTCPPSSTVHGPRCARLVKFKQEPIFCPHSTWRAQEDLWAAVLLWRLLCLWLWVLDSEDWGLREIRIQKREKGGLQANPSQFSSVSCCPRSGECVSGSPFSIPSL